MKEFDIDKIGKKMPYSAPSEEFFDNFESELFKKITPSKREKSMVLRLFIPICSAAAALFVGLFLFADVDSKESLHMDQYAMNGTLEECMDSYFASLSDDELASLLVETSSQDDFYASLPSN